MKQVLFLVLISISFFLSNAQTSQISIGSPGITESFYDNKIDPTDEGNVNVGFINDPASGNDNDLFIVKTDANHEIQWQKTIANPGDDIFYKVIVCTNGDYIACGHMFVAGVRRAVACRFNGTNGNIIWTVRSPSGLGEVFWNLTETTDTNIILVGAESFSTGLTNSFIVSLNAAGTMLWSRVSSTSLADEFRVVAQLPNGNLIVGGFYNPSGSFYSSTILEIDPVTTAIVSQRVYNFNDGVPGGLLNNASVPNSVSVVNNTVLFYFLAFQGFGSASNQCIYSYDLTTKNLSGNIYYEPGKSNATGYSFFPISENDFLISQSYATPSSQVSVSRVTNGVVVYDRKVNSNVTSLSNTDIFNGKSVSSGICVNAGSNAYDLFSLTDLAVENSFFDISAINTLALQPSNLTGISQNVIALSSGMTVPNVTLTSVNTTYSLDTICAPFNGISETVQIKIGKTGITESFSDTKIDPNDEGTINVGYINNSATTTGNDLFMVKLNSNHEMVWQKIITNAGDDNFQRVIVCANGDYLVCGYLFVGGLRKAIASRINSSNGNIIWSYISSNGSTGELFWDVIETASNNIALVGADSYTTGLTNSFIVLLNSTGATQWSYISNTPLADEFKTVVQLQNGNLLVAGFYNPFNVNYYGTMLEFNESTAAIVNQNIYNINASVPGGLTNNSLWPTKMYIKNNSVLVDCVAFQGFNSDATHCVYTYDQTTKNLIGNIYYQPGKSNSNGYTFYPLSENDFLFSQIYLSPATQASISRVTNGSVVFDRKINSAVNSIYGSDVFNSKSLFGGTYTAGGLDAYNLFSSTNFPASVFPCSITNLNTLTLQASNLNATATNVISLVSASALSSTTPTIQDPTYIVENVCGLIVPVTLLNFTGTYDKSSQSSILQWSTATEVNNKMFTIERSNDGGINYFPVGSVDARGNSNTVARYQFNDATVQNGVNLYRLKQIDINGKFAYSNVVSINVKKEYIGLYSLSPIPAGDYSFIKSSNAESEIIDIALIDVSGKIIKQQKSVISNSQYVKLDLHSISAGSYFVKIISAKNGLTTLKLQIR